VQALAWMGADIAKLENPKGGEAGRTGFGDAYYFMMYNANKRSITINLKSHRGLALVKALVKEMVKKPDVFTENFAPGAVERLGSATMSSARSIPASSMPRSRASETAARPHCRLVIEEGVVTSIRQARRRTPAPPPLRNAPDRSDRPLSS
jgi:hypothetical protein